MSSAPATRLLLLRHAEVEAARPAAASGKAPKVLPPAAKAPVAPAAP